MSRPKVRFPDQPQIGEQLDDLLGALEGAIFTGTGRAKNLREKQLLQEVGLTERFGRLFGDIQQDLQQRFISQDPVAAALQQRTLGGIRQEGSARRDLLATARAGVQGLRDGGLPTDVEGRISERARAGALARGIDLGEQSALITETAALIGGEERFRQQRLGQLSSAIGRSAQLTQPGLQLLNVPSPQAFGLGLPSAANLLQAGTARTGQILQGRIAQEQFQTQQDIAFMNFLSQSAENLGGFAF